MWEQLVRWHSCYCQVFGGVTVGTDVKSRLPVWGKFSGEFFTKPYPSLNGCDMKEAYGGKLKQNRIIYTNIYTEFILNEPVG